MHALGDAIEKSPDWTVCCPAGRPTNSGGARLFYVILARLREKKMGWEFYEEALKREDDDAGVVMRARDRQGDRDHNNDVRSNSPSLTRYECDSHARLRENSNSSLLICQVGL